VLGLVITMLSATGVYIWWKKRAARRFRKTRGSSAGAPLEPPRPNDGAYSSAGDAKFSDGRSP
jgi:uncharacterized iron-regulated membrane protein